MKQVRYNWAAPGDINAFFGLMLDNIAGLVIAVTMLTGIFGFPSDFVLRYMVPGTAIGVLVGDLMYFWLAFRLAKVEKRDVTAMPLGLDTPSTIGMVLFVLGPAFAGASKVMDEQAAAMHAWHIGICAIVMTGLIKGVLAIGSNWIRNVFPRAGLLGSLAAIALVLIAFMQLTKIAENPVVGFASLVIVLATLIARGHLPFKIPGAFAAVFVGCLILYLSMGIDAMTGSTLAHQAKETESVWFPVEWLTVFQFEWVSAMGEAFTYMPYILPFAIATVIGGIDCTESAASVGDSYETRHIIGVESAATIIAALCGGVIQTTPYIGHPAYKAMGGRAAYTLATALFVGGAGVIGYFSLLFMFIPEAAIVPILIFVGIEITAQSFHATPRRHYAALAIACLPAIAKLLAINLEMYVDREKFLTDPGILSIRILAGGFIITSLIWASAMAKIIDRRFYAASLYFAVGGILVLFGVMHSPMVGDKMYWPWDIGMVEQNGEIILNEGYRKLVWEFAASYLVMAILMFGLGAWMRPELIDTDEQFEKLQG